MYKLNPKSEIGADSVVDLNRNLTIPFDPVNTDYQTFKADVLAGAELQDVDGNVMSYADARDYILTLP